MASISESAANYWGQRCAGWVTMPQNWLMDYLGLNILDVGFQDSHGYEAGLIEKAKSLTVQFNC